MEGVGAPAVSVLIPARNAADTVADALESLARQSEPSFEAIVVDDESTDGTADVAGLFAERDGRFQVLRGDAHGVSAARNRALAEARAEWLLFLNADDWIEPDGLRLLLSRAREGDEPGAVVGAWARATPRGERFGHHLWERPDEALDCFAATCAFAIHSCLVRRSLVAELGGFDESLVTCEDWERLGKPVSAIAYPYGDLDDAIAHLAGACGYTLGLTCEARHAELTDNPLKLPRFEIRGDLTLADLDRTLARE